MNIEISKRRAYDRFCHYKSSLYYSTIFQDNFLAPFEILQQTIKEKKENAILHKPLFWIPLTDSEAVGKGETTGIAAIPCRDTSPARPYHTAL